MARLGLDDIAARRNGGRAGGARERRRAGAEKGCTDHQGSKDLAHCRSPVVRFGHRHRLAATGAMCGPTHIKRGRSVLTRDQQEAEAPGAGYATVQFFAYSTARIPRGMEQMDLITSFSETTRATRVSDLIPISQRISLLSFISVILSSNSTSVLF